MFVPREEPKTEINTTAALWDFAENKHCGKNKKLTLSYKKEPRHIYMSTSPPPRFMLHSHGFRVYTANQIIIFFPPLFADPRNGDELT